MACIAPLAGEFLLAGALAGVGYALGKRKREPTSEEQLAVAVKALKTTAEVLEVRSRAENDQLARLTEKMQELEGKVKTGASASHVEQFAGRVQELEDRLAEEAKAAKVEVLTERVQDLEGMVQADPTRGQVAELSRQVRKEAEAAGGRLGQLQDRLQVLQEKIGAESASSRTHMEACDSKLEQFAQRAGDLEEQSNSCNGQMVQIEHGVGQLQQRVDAVEAKDASGRAEAEAASRRASEVAGRLGALEGRLEAEARAARLDALAERLRGMEERAEVEAGAGDLARLAGQVQDAQQVAQAALSRVERHEEESSQQVAHLHARLEALQDEVSSEAGGRRAEAEATSHKIEQLAEQAAQMQKQGCCGDHRMEEVERDVGDLRRRLCELEDEDPRHACEPTAVAAPATPPSAGVFGLVQRLAADVEELKRTRHDHARELQSSDGLVLDLQAKIGSLGVCIDTANERIRAIELASGMSMRSQVKQEQEQAEYVGGESEEIW